MFNGHNKVTKETYNFDKILKKYNCSFDSKTHERYSVIKVCKNVKYLISFKYKKNEAKCAIFSLAYRYKKENLYIFINSLKKAGYTGDLYFLVSRDIDNDTRKYLDNKKSYYLKLDENWPYYSKDNLLFPIEFEILYKYVPKIKLWGIVKFIILRYFIVYVFLYKYKNKYDYILSADLKDVLFQRNPFNWNIPRGVVLFEESRKLMISESRCNLMWIDNISKHYSKMIASFYILNGGIIFCTTLECLDFFRIYIKIANDSKIQNPNDQAIFNIIAYHENRKIAVSVFPDYLGPVKTMAIEYRQPNCRCNNYNPCKNSILLVNKENLVMNIDGSIPHILHSNSASKNDPFIMKTRQKYSSL